MEATLNILIYDCKSGDVNTILARKTIQITEENAGNFLVYELAWMQAQNTIDFFKKTGVKKDVEIDVFPDYFWMGHKDRLVYEVTLTKNPGTTGDVNGVEK